MKENENAEQEMTELTKNGEPFVPENPDQMPTLDESDGEAAYTDGPLSREEWYQTAMTGSHMRLGNNRRLKAVIERARAGEKVTIAAIGGSITEGAGAKKYRECYVCQFFHSFCREYGKGDGSNVSLVNAGVGGTPSPFGYLRYGREVAARTENGLPDIVVIEFSVNDYQEPTEHRCFESMVKEILQQPNHPAVILLFAVFPNGFNLQKELRPIGDAYDLMMVSILDGAFPFVGDKWTSEEFFFDIYHPTTLGHKVMADCLISAVQAAEEKDTAQRDIDLNVPAVYGTDFQGLKTIYKTQYQEDIGLKIGSFSLDDDQAYRNLPIGRVCGENFHHGTESGEESLSFRANCKNFLIAYRAVNDETFGSVEVCVDGKAVKTLQGNTGSWGQSVPELIFSDRESAPHRIEIRMAPGDEKKKFTITCMGYTP